MLLSAFYILSCIAVIVSLLALRRGTRVLQELPLAVFVWIGFNALWFGLLTLVGIGFSLVLALVLNIGITAAIPLVRKMEGGGVPCPLNPSAHSSKGKFALSPLAKRDMLIWSILLVLIIAMALCRYGFPPQITFLSGDAAYHFMASRRIAEGAVMTDPYISHLVSAITISSFDFLVAPLERYMIFIVTEIALYFLSVVMFYSLLSVLCPKMSFAWMSILVILYAAGFPLTTLFMGFSYLGFAVAAVCALLFVSVQYCERPYNTLGLALISLLLYEIAVSYILFAPAIFMGVFVFIILAGRRVRKRWSQIIVAEAAVFAVPVLLGAVLVGLPLILPAPDGSGALLSGLANDGTSFCATYAPFVFIAPLSFVGVANRAKKRPLQLVDVVSLVYILFCVAMFVGIFLHFISIYYYSKVLDIAWLIFFAYAGIGVASLMVESKRFLLSYAIVWGMLLAVALPNIDGKLSAKYARLAPTALASELYPVYVFNLQEITNRRLSAEAMEAFAEINTRIRGGEKVALLMANTKDSRWYGALYEDSILLPYWSMRMEEIEKRLEEYDAVFVGTQGNGIKSDSGTPYADLIDKLLGEHEEVIYSNETGRLLSLR